MDKIDRKILYELDKNSRATFSQIAKATNISQETVRYRINKYTKNGTIVNFLSILNTTKLGNLYYQIMLRLQNVNETKKKEIINFLRNSNKVAWIANLEGNYDIGFIFYIKNQIELQEITSELFQRYSKYIMKKNISMNLYAEFLPRDYLLDKKRSSKKTTYKSHKSMLTLDATDKKICQLLGKDSRTSTVKISEVTNLSTDTILQRLRKLKQKEILQAYTIVPNQKEIGQSHYKLLLYLNSLTEQKEKSLMKAIRNNNRVIAIIKKLAEWDYEIDLEIENIEQLKKFTMELTNTYSDTIRDYDIIRIVDMPKYTFFP